jgi:hypothetical protein
LTCTFGSRAALSRHRTPSRTACSDVSKSRPIGLCPSADTGFVQAEG